MKDLNLYLWLSIGLIFYFVYWIITSFAYNTNNLVKNIMTLLTLYFNVVETVVFVIPNKNVIQ